MKSTTKIFLVITGVLLIIVCGVALWKVTENNDMKLANKVDDWKYEGAAEENDNWLGNVFKNSFTQESAMDSASSPIGFSVGGAKDIENFRENIEEGYFPISTDITYNGLFYDYTFDTGVKKESNDLFSPSYSTAVSKDPFSEKKEYYMTVGLNSNIKESDFARKKLNVVIVLDISGSMSSDLDAYYYDNPFKEVVNKSKMQAACESVNLLIDQLNDDDRLGMVLFGSSAYLAKPLNLVSETDMDAIKGHILEITASGGGTNFEAGYQEATKLFKELKDVNKEEYENRIIIITDAMPNYGQTSKEGLLSYMEDNSNDGIYTTFIGVGVDFNTSLIESISDVKGANYYSVHTVEEFKERMGEQFEYMVTPLVFDLKLNFESDDYKIASVYGSDTVNKADGSIIEVNTLFPSKTTSTGEVKGGVVLLKLEKLTDKEDGTLTLNVSYKDRNGTEHENSDVVNFKNSDSEVYDNLGIRKAIVLTRYANTMKNWILYERSEEERFLVLPVSGIIDCDYTMEEVKILLGEHERRSVSLSVSDEYKNIFSKLKEYMEKEIETIGDKTMNQEVEILDKLINENVSK